MEKLTLNVQTYDEAHNFIVEEYGIFSSKQLDKFYSLGRTDEAVQYAIDLGFNIED